MIDLTQTSDFPPLGLSPDNASDMWLALHEEEQQLRESNGFVEPLELSTRKRLLLNLLTELLICEVGSLVDSPDSMEDFTNPKLGKPWGWKADPAQGEK